MPPRGAVSPTRSVRPGHPIDLDRPQQVVEIQVHKIRRRYKAFDPSNFSVHRLPRDFLPGGDPMLASNPPPEIAAQILDRDGDGIACEWNLR